MIVDDHQALAGALARTIRRRGFEVHTTAGPTAADIVAQARRLAPLIVLLDLDLGDVCSGSDLVEPLVEAGARVSVFSGGADRAQAAVCVERGAIGVILKTMPLEDLLDAVEQLAAGDELLSVQQRAIWGAELEVERRRLAPFELLSSRETQVLQSLVAGHRAEDIASEMFVSLPTVRTHIKAMLRKLGVQSQLAAVAVARESGWPPRPR